MQTLIHGNDSFLSREHLGSVVDRLQEENPKAAPKTAIETYDAEEVEPQTILYSLETLSLFAPQKIVVIKRPYKSADKQTLIEKLLETLPKVPDTIHVIVWSGKKVASNTRLAKYFKKIDSIEEFEEMKPRQVRKWLDEELEEAKLELAGEVKESLLERAGFDLPTIKQEIQKLTLLGEKKVDLKILERVVPQSLESEIWPLIDAVNESDRKEASRQLQNLTRARYDPHGIIAMLARQLRLIAMVKALKLEGCDTKEIASRIRQHPFVISKVRKHSDKITKERLGVLFQKLVDLDLATKTGRIEPNLALSLFISLL